MRGRVDLVLTGGQVIGDLGCVCVGCPALAFKFLAKCPYLNLEFSVPEMLTLVSQGRIRFGWGCGRMLGVGTSS